MLTMATIKSSIATQLHNLYTPLKYLENMGYMLRGQVYGLSAAHHQLPMSHQQNPPLHEGSGVLLSLLCQSCSTAGRTAYHSPPFWLALQMQGIQKEQGSNIIRQNKTNF